MRRFLQQGLLFLILIFFLETFFRAYIISPSQINSWGYNPKGLGDLLPNRNFIADELPQLPYQVITNSQGLRDKNEIIIPKPAGSFRVLAIGDSLTFGPYVNQPDTYPARLEQNLKNQNLNAEVINAGIPGYTLIDELEYLQEKGIHLQPDLIILGIYQNDVSDYWKLKRTIYSRESHKKPNRIIATIYNLAKKSAVLTAIEKYITAKKVQDLKRQTALDSNTNFANEFNAYSNDLSNLISYLDQNKTPVIFVFFPTYDQVTGHQYQPQNKIMETLDDKYAIVDLLPAFQTNEDPYSLFLLPDNGHLSAYGDFITAKNVASQIMKNKVQ